MEELVLELFYRFDKSTKYKKKRFTFRNNAALGMCSYQTSISKMAKSYQTSISKMAKSYQTSISKMAKSYQTSISKMAKS